MENIKKCIICENETKFGSETCSRICAGELKKKRNREIRKCVFCEKKFEAKKKSTKKLCSDECRKSWAKIPENKVERIKKSHEAIKEKNEGKYFFQTDEFKEKAKNTKINIYGDENFVNNEKAKQTKKEKYGDENFINNEKAKQTKKERYGDENYNNRHKAKETMKKIYGVEHVMKLKDFQKKAQNKNFENTGFNFPLQNQTSKENKKETNLEKYGFEHASQSKEVKNKIKDWYFDRFELTKINKQLENSDIKLIDEYKGLRTKIEESTQYFVYNFRCDNCGNNFTGTFSNHRIPICRVCYPTYKNNFIHQEIFDFLNQINVKFNDNIRNIIAPYELDFYIEKHNIAIELNGNYWHSEIGGGKDRNYHLNKSELCNKLGIKLIHIFEDEWIFKKDIVKSMLLNLIGKIDNKIYARKCELKEVNSEEGFEFLNNNHIQGAVNFNKAIGLYYDSKLVSLMSFVERKNNIWELNRFCSSQGFVVVGAFSKLFKYFLKINDNVSSVKTFADCRWSGLDYKESVYYKCNFKFKEKIKPRYFYFKQGDYIRRYHRFTFNKQKLIKLHQDKYENWMSEWDLAQAAKMDRIWDCGKLSYEFFISSKDL